MAITRGPEVAGLFYPDNAEDIHNLLAKYFAQAKPSNNQPKAIIAPHAGFIYSGPIAANAYACLKGRSISRVILLGPAHRYGFEGVAIPTAEAMLTPLGEVPIDDVLRSKVSHLSGVQLFDKPFDGEHCLEVQLPFLQKLLKDFTVLPVVVGIDGGDAAAEIIDSLWGGDETLIVISSDLSHFLEYEQAQYRDKKTVQAILDLIPEKLNGRGACGCYPIQGLLKAAKKHPLKGKLLDLRNSGDTAGDKSRVVGYAAMHFMEQ